MSSNVVHRSIRKTSLPRTGRALDAAAGGVSSSGGATAGGSSFAGYWSLITTDKDNNPLEEAAQYIKTKYTAVSEGDVVAYATSDHDIVLPHAGYNMLGAVQIKPDSGLIIDSATGMLSVDPAYAGGGGGGVDFTTGSGLQLSGKVLSVKYGVAVDTVAAGNDSRILNGQKAFEVISKGTWWGQKMTDAGVVSGAMTGVTNINGKLSFVDTGVDVTDNIRATGDVVAYATGSGDISDWLGLVIDNDTIRFNDAGKLYAAGGGGQAGIAGITVSGSGNAITSVALSADKTSLTFTKGSTFALKSEIPIIPSSLKNPYSLTWSGYSSGSYDGSSAKTISIPSNTSQLTNGAGFITGINQTMILNALTGAGSSSKYLAGNGTFYTIAYSELSGTPDLSIYVTLAGTQTISGYKHFSSGLSSGSKSGAWIDISANNYINGMSGSSLYNLYLNYVNSSKFVRIDNSCNITATGDIVAYSTGASGTALSISWSEIIGKPSGLVTSVSITGSGNAVTGASFSGGQLSLSKGTISGGGGSTVSWGTDTGNTVDLSVNGTSKKLTLAGGFSVTGTSSLYRTVVIAGNSNNYSLYGHTHAWSEITSKPSGLVTSVSISGSGNAITAASFSSNTLYLTKGTISGGSSSISWSSVTGKPSGLVTSVSISGSGNALTGASFSGGTLYLSKGTISSGSGSWNGGSVSNSISCPYLWVNTSSSSYRLAVNGTSTYTGKAEFGNTVQISGSCWIGTTSSSYKCAINGSGVITGTWTQNSDIRLKNRLYDVTGILPRLSGIDVFAFTMKSGDATRRLGVSAQQIQSVFPELIGCDTATEEKYLSVDYSTLGTIVAIQGCKELYAEIRTLKNRIKELEDQLNINAA